MDEQIAKLFAPQVRLSSTDPWFPVSVEWFVDHSSLWYEKIKSKSFWNTTKQKRIQICVDETPSLDSLHLYPLENEKGDFDITSFGESASDRKPNWFLKLKSEEYYKGMSLEELNESLIPIYVHVNKLQDYTDIQYFYLYAFNGNIVDKMPELGIHEGDWEHTTVRLSNEIWSLVEENEDNCKLKECIIAIFYARHGHEGKWYFDESSGISDLDDGYQLVDDTLHHVVYSAKGGHASYTIACSQNRRYVPFGVPLRIIDDYTDDKGPKWNTWNNIVLLDNTNENQNWLHFNGQWGGKANNILCSSGPYGPLMKTYYFSGNPQPSSYNSVYNNSIPHPCAPHLEVWSNCCIRCFIISIIVFVLLSGFYIFYLYII